MNDQEEPGDAEEWKPLEIDEAFKVLASAIAESMEPFLSQLHQVATNICMTVQDANRENAHTPTGFVWDSTATVIDEGVKALPERCEERLKPCANLEQEESK